ncbi:MAG: permease YjgP/YjgQ family protein [Bacteroidetes bacterium]|nr:permease YjgP/YjgQ family protein [Bacteroidota bacterium]
MILARYILRAHIGPFFFALSTLMFLFLLQFVMKFIDQLVGKGLSAWVILELILLNLSWMLVLAVPMSVLMAVLMAFGGLASRNEITAMRAGGVSLTRMMMPVVIASVVLAGVMVWFNNFVLPESNYRLKTLTMDIRRKRPTLSLVDGVFSQDISGYSILVKKARQKTNELEGVTLYDYTDPARNVTITADRGKISFSSDYRKLIMDLQEGEIHTLDLDQMTAYRKIRFTTHRIAMDVEGFDFERSAKEAFSRSDRELSARVMRRIVDSLRTVGSDVQREYAKAMETESERLLQGQSSRPAPTQQRGRTGTGGAATLQAVQYIRGVATSYGARLDGLRRQTNQYLVEIHKKYSIPAACIVFVLIGAPLGVITRRGGFGIAASMSLGFFVLYWSCLIGGEKLADRGIVSPFTGMWIANIIIGLLGVYLTARVRKESFLVNWVGLLRFLPRRWRSAASPDTAAPT